MENHSQNPSTHIYPYISLSSLIHSNTFDNTIDFYSKMRKHESMFALAADTATNSPFRMAHGAVLVRSGDVLATASNHLGGNRLSPSCPSTHAEIATLARFFGGNVKQCFEKPAKELSVIDKQRQSGFDPPESKQRVSRASKQQHQQKDLGGRRCGGYNTTCVPRPGSYVRCAKQKDQGGKKDQSFVLWHKEDKRYSQGKEAMCRRLRYVYC